MNHLTDLSMLANFSNQIVHWRIINYENEPDFECLKAEIQFSDSSRLMIFEKFFLDTNNFRYGYQWMNEQNQTIFRWDNTPHFPQFDTFPAHRHVGEQEMGEPFATVSLEDVLIFIASQLNP